MLTLSLVLALGALPTPAEVGFAVQLAEDEEIAEARAAARVRGGISLVGSNGLGFATNAFAVGGGLSADVGVTFADRYAIALRLTGTFFLLLSAALEFEFVLSERVLFGLGASWGVFGGLDAPGASWVGLPVRVTWAFWDRPREAIARSGFALFAEVTPGFGYANSRGLSNSSAPLGIPLTIVALVGIGYAWW
ncbi:MAG: hypothetical protein Q8L14_20180 [Myxococcales bacterium]|nr:hypothetical protein [Myxococcales bacterium]